MGGELQHFGIKGMRWGIRRERGPDGTVGGFGKKAQLKPKKEPHDDRKRAEDLKKKGVKNLSNAELKEYNNRLQLEKQFKDLSKQEVSEGKKAVTDILKNSGKTVATTIVTATALYAGKKAIEYFVGPNIMKEIFPKKKK